jgi:bacteriocin biosynthesis cyclodehydratase domain-containing protein
VVSTADSHTSDNSAITIARGLDITLISEDEAMIEFGSRSYPSELLRDRDLSGTLGRLFRILLKEPVTVDYLVSTLDVTEQDGARSLLDDLLSRGILTNLATDPIEQYINYTHTGGSALSSYTVSVIGAGPLGARISYSLVQHGIGKLNLLDDRHVDDDWRALAPLGLSADAQAKQPTDPHARTIVRDVLQATGSSEVESLELPLDLSGVTQAAKHSDLLILALERPVPRLSHLINRVCHQHERAWLLTTMDGDLGIAGPLFLPTHTACFYDYSTLTRAAARSTVAKGHASRISERGFGSFFCGLPAHCDIVAGYASLAAVHFLLRNNSFLLGRSIIIDFQRMTLDTDDILRLPRCPVCGTRNPAHQPPFAGEIVTSLAASSVLSDQES